MAPTIRRAGQALARKNDGSILFSPAPVATGTRVVRQCVLLNLDEFITRE